jgi:hypothetical protein
MPVRRRGVAAALLCRPAMIVLAASARAEDYPTHPVRNLRSARLGARRHHVKW